MHSFLVHQRGDHVGVATTEIAADSHITGSFLDDGSTIEVQARSAILFGHKIAIAAREPGDDVIEYGVRIGRAPAGFAVGDYVHTHNLKSARW